MLSTSLIVAVDNRVIEDRSLTDQVREVFVPLMPGQVATAALAAILAVAYTNLGFPVLLGVGRCCF